MLFKSIASIGKTHEIKSKSISLNQISDSSNQQNHNEVQLLGLSLNLGSILGINLNL
ncbi:hypothetical protein RB653_006855 [Dictyostelium firmibasis]|uniref:Uncharacterized protein n=1 Tax=Dictyostelium firmibasis TaxID=79012 RepID=A0AAN7YQN2_9MYCE